MNYLPTIKTRGKVSVVKAFIIVLAGQGMVKRTLAFRLLNNKFAEQKVLSCATFERKMETSKAGRKR